MRLRELLDQRHVQYRWARHEPAYTSQGLAQRLHRSGHAVIKPVLVEADGRYVMCAVPAPALVDPDRVRSLLEAEEAHIADESDLQRACEGCELGAEPPIGSLFHLPTVMDDSLCYARAVSFQAGTHRDAVTVEIEDFIKLAEPKIGHITF
jgi:Ala-tRNA(Pro) deacylase